MSSYLGTLFNTTANRVASLKQNLLPSENDGDTEDDTHICRVLRGYYTEKGRPFPAWLPPDPRAPPPVVIQPVYSQPGVGSRYGGLQNQPPAGSGALSSLWDSQPQQQQPPQDPQSLRHGRGASANRLGAPARQNPFTRQQSAQELKVEARPLPSQRAGSYQTAGAGALSRADTQTPPAGAMTAQEKLRQKLRGGARAPSPSGPAMANVADHAIQRNNSYGSSGAGSNYEDRFAGPPGGYDGGGGGGRPFVAATAPWASNEAEFSGGGYSGGYDSGSRGGGGRQGLPSGPAAGRRGPGLPRGPR